jgi:hypothetical protein
VLVPGDGGAPEYQRQRRGSPRCLRRDGRRPSVEADPFHASAALAWRPTVHAPHTECSPASRNAYSLWPLASGTGPPEHPRNATSSPTTTDQHHLHGIDHLVDLVPSQGFDQLGGRWWWRRDARRAGSPARCSGRSVSSRSGASGQPRMIQPVVSRRLCTLGRCSCGLASLDAQGTR